MTSVLGALDAISVRAATLTGLKACYTATGSGLATATFPQGVDDGPVGYVWLGPGQMQAGNAETVIFTAMLDIWSRATDIGTAYKALAAFPDLAYVLFRTDTDLGGQVDRCLMTGWDEPQGREDNGGQPYLVLTIRLEVLLMNFGSFQAV